MAYYHGVRTTESPTSLLAPAQTESGLIFAVGTAPIHLVDGGKVNEPVLSSIET